MTTDDRTPLMRQLDALEVWDVQTPPQSFTDQVLTRARGPKPKRHAASRIAVAAIAAALVLGLLGWWSARQLPVQAGSLVATARHTVPLTAGTTIVAEPGAELRWAERDGTLEVEQRRGSAFYRVDPRDPEFVVQTPAGSIQVRGTCFSVDLEEANSLMTDKRPPKPADPRRPLALGAALAVAATVTVYEGRTVLANDSGVLELSAGERGTARSGSAPSRSNPAALSLAERSGGLSDTTTQELHALRSENRRQATELQELHSQLGRAPEADDTTAPDPKKRTRFSAWGPPIPEGFDHYQPTQAALEEMAECGIVAWDQPPVWADDQQPDPEYLDALGLTAQERTMFEAAFHSFRSETIATARSFYVELGGDSALAEAIDPTELLGMVYGRTDLDTREDSRIALAMERAGLAEAPSEELQPSERFLRWDANLGNAFEASLEEHFGAQRAQELRAARDGWPGKRATWADLCNGHN
ncbi:MAG: FecR domain-containing protein [Nannocystales bacterium]